MPVTDGPLDPKVGEALCDDQNVVSVMQHPKMAEALGLLKKDPSQYYSSSRTIRSSRRYSASSAS